MNSTDKQAVFKIFVTTTTPSILMAIFQGNPGKLVLLWFYFSAYLGRQLLGISGTDFYR